MAAFLHFSTTVTWLAETKLSTHRVKWITKFNCVINKSRNSKVKITKLNCSVNVNKEDKN